MPDESGAPDTTPSVTMVIPTFNRAEFLSEAIESVLKQDYERLELLVLDDGSTDGTPELLEGFAESNPADRFRWDRHDNMGQARTLNRGFEMASGELVGYLSSDDALLPGAIAKLAEVFQSEPGVVVAYPAWESIDDAGERIQTVMPEEFTLLHALRASDPVIGPGALLRRRVIDEVGGWNPDFVYSPDFEFWVRVAAAGEFRRVPEPLSLYRWHEGMTGRASQGLRLTLERVAIVDQAFAMVDLPDEVREVEAEAYRNAYLAGAGILALNAPWERFFLADRLERRILPGGEFAAKMTGLREREAELEGELRECGDRLAALGDSLTRREMEIESREARQ
jgi:glycosyltransferase involved in cell wall biosynthesis